MCRSQPLLVLENQLLNFQKLSELVIFKNNYINLQLKYVILKTKQDSKLITS